MPKPMLILLPGMLGTADLFGPLLDTLPADQPRRIISYPVDRVLSFDALSRLIETDLQDEFNLVLIGESFSGSLAVKFAAAHPNRVRAVVMSAGFVRSPFPKWTRRLIYPVLFRIPLPLFAVRWVVAGMNAPDPLVRQIRSALRRPDPLVLADRARQALSVDCSDSLRRCKPPILYLSPSWDHLVFGFNMRRVLRIRPDIHIRMIDGPHLLLQTVPAKAWEAIESFLNLF